MSKISIISRRGLLALTLAGGVGMTMALAPLSLQAAELDSIHFLIPGGAGGGWDGTARGTG